MRTEAGNLEAVDLDGSHGRVLIIEDNTDIALLLNDFFTERGHLTDYAYDGLTGLHLAATNEHDVIILDLALPGLTGLNCVNSYARLSARMCRSSC